MTYQTITFSIADDIATATLNRPEQMNALTTQLRAELTDAVKTAEAQARVLVITGAGRGFCSGQDLVDAAKAGDFDLETTLRDEYEPMLQAIYGCRIPTISAVNGAAVGAGANLALAADVVIASDAAYFTQAFTRIGLIPDAGGTYWLPRQIGAARAMGAALFADKITAQQACDWGMIYEVVAEDAFAARIHQRALHLAQGPTETYRHLKQAMRASFANTLDTQLALEAEMQGLCGRTADFREGVTAFLEKRPPVYKGR